MTSFLWAFLGGILPALLWLWFWLREDGKHPEPKKLIFAAFVAGMFAVPPALFLEGIAKDIFQSGFYLLLAWATIEEVVKYLGAHIVAFRSVCLDKSRCVDEPIDPAIYMITAALGFAALENTLFLLAPIGQGSFTAGLITGNLRFVGAMVLHVVASSSIGLAMGLSFYKSAWAKRIYFLIGLFTSIVLHTLFNVFIILNEGDNVFVVFGGLWIAVLVVLAVFERTKRVKNRVQGSGYSV
ncbi:MAG: PrsW family intramembrane metalloprotease [Parcubacteria group bacterium]|nr:PrsW family intramembrane metalloprotease [Parcubacteria group bacterium]